MKVIVNKPAPAPPPPKTYDLLGVTEDEVRAIRASLGFWTRSDAEGRGVNYHVCIVLRDELRLRTGVTYSVGASTFPL